MTLPEDIAQNLTATYGLDPSHYGGTGLESIVSQRREASGIGDEKAYFDLLRRDDGELAALVNELLIPESWFFRDGVPFVHLRDWVGRVWLPSPDAGKRRLRLLSLPCAGGQEAWSLAITMLEAGLKPGEFSILAGDLSQRFLEQAIAGHYRRIAFRGDDFCDRSQYFDDAGDGCMRVKDFLREMVNFRQLNLLNPPGYQAFGPYDIIFCRNVLIYFDDASRRQAFEGLTRCLSPEGLLFVGHADSLQRITNDFTRSGPGGAFCYMRRQAQGKEPAPPEKSKAHPKPLGLKSHRRFPEVVTELPRTERAATGGKPGPEPERKNAVAALEHAQALANSGRLEEAEAVCREALAESPGDAAMLYLLGEVLLSRKKIAESEAQFRRVVYLEPKHEDALFRLAMLAEQRGDYHEAANWRRRATRPGAGDKALISHE